MKKIKFDINYSCDYIAQDIAEDLADAINKGEYGNDWDLYELIAEEIDRYCTYAAEQWKVLQAYCMPEDANWSEAIQMLFDEIADQLVTYELDVWEDWFGMDGHKIDYICQQVDEYTIKTNLYYSNNLLTTIIHGNNIEPFDYLNSKDGQEAKMQMVEWFEAHN